jgi:hypothetical protein
MKKRLAHQISGGSSSGQAPKLKRASTDPLSGAVALGSEQTLQKKLDAIKNTFKQKRVEAYGLRVEGAKQRVQAANAQAALSALDRQFDAFLSDLETFGRQAGVPGPEAGGERSSLLKVVLAAGEEDVAADTTKYVRKVARVAQVLGLGGDDGDEDDEEEDEGDTGVEAARQIELNTLISSRMISERVGGEAAKKLERARAQFKALLVAVDGKAHGLARDKVLAEAQAAAKRLQARMAALEDHVAASNFQLKAVTAERDEERDINARLMWRLVGGKGGATAQAPSSDAAVAPSGGTPAGAGGGGGDNGELEHALKKAGNDIARLETDVENWKTQAEDRKKEIDEVRMENVKVLNEMRNLRSGPPSKAVLALSPDYVQALEVGKRAAAEVEAAQREARDARAQLDLQAAALADYKKQCSASVHALRDEWQGQVSRERDSAQKYTKYADDLKAKLHEEQLKSKGAVALAKDLAAATALVENQRGDIKRLDRLVALLESATDKEEETKQLYAELAEVEEAFGAQEAESAALAKQLAGKEERNRKLASEKRKVEQQVNLEKQKTDLSMHQVTQLKKRASNCDARIAQLDRDLKGYESRNRELEKRNDALEKVEAAWAREKAAAGGEKAAVGAGGGGARVQGLLKELEDKTKEISKKKGQQKRLEEQVGKLERKNSKLKSQNSSLTKGRGPSGEMFARISAAMHCSLNQDLWKDCLIKTCGHAFARASLEAQLAKRNRNCPKCGLKYDKLDLVAFNLKEELEME